MRLIHSAAFVVAVARRRLWPNSGFLMRLTIFIVTNLPRIMPWRASVGHFDRLDGPWTILWKNQKISGCAHDHVGCRYRRGGKPDARSDAAMGRRRCLCPVSFGRKPAADRSRHDVADHGRAMDPRPSRGPADRRLFLHHARPALDLDAVAGAGALRQGLWHRGLERAGGVGGRCDRGDVRAIGAIVEPSPERQHRAGLRRRGAGADGAASCGAAACAGDAGDGDMGRRADRSGR